MGYDYGKTSILSTQTPKVSILKNTILSRNIIICLIILSMIAFMSCGALYLNYYYQQTRYKSMIRVLEEKEANILFLHEEINKYSTLLMLNSFNLEKLEKEVLKHKYDSVSNEDVKYIIHLCCKYPQPWSFLLIAIIIRESQFRSDAISSVGAVGLTQVFPKFWVKELVQQKIISTQPDLFEPTKSIEAGYYIIRKYYEQTGDIYQALIKYSNSRKYAHSVLSLQFKLRERSL